MNANLDVKKIPGCVRLCLIFCMFYLASLENEPELCHLSNFVTCGLLDQEQISETVREISFLHRLHPTFALASRVMRSVVLLCTLWSLQLLGLRADLADVTCDFENGACGWSLEGAWAMHSGEGNDGPTAYQGNNYVFISGSDPNNGDEAGA